MQQAIRAGVVVAVALLAACGEDDDSCGANSDCDDGLYCNGVEVCDANRCAAGEAPGQDDAIACTVDACDEATDAITHTTDNAACDDGLYCNGVEACHAELGCTAGTAPTADDGIGCTIDSCDEVADQIVHAPNNTVCGDADACTSDVCTPGLGCTHPVVCACSNPGQCNDQNPCSTDDCTLGACVYNANAASCDDGLYCNGADMCAAMACTQHLGDPCGSGGECNDACNEANDTCFDQQGIVCSSDGNSCTDDRCDGAGGCGHASNTASCNDGLYCNGFDTCSNGACDLHTGDPCAACNGTCMEAGDTCQYPQAVPPVISPPAGLYTTAQVLSIASPSPNTSVRYTLDGSTPTQLSTPYVAPLLGLTPQLVTAAAFGVCYSPSDPASALVDVEDDLVVHQACPTMPAVAWSGSRWGVVWVARFDCNSPFNEWATLKFAVLNADGTLAAPVLSVTTDPSVSRAQYPAITWNGSSFSIVWQESRDTATLSKIYFAKAGIDGSLVDLPAGEPDGIDDNVVRVTGAIQRDEEGPAILWDGARHAVGWADDRGGYTDIYTAFLDANGRKLDIAANEADGTDDDETRVSSGRFWTGGGPTLAWTGSQLGVAWYELAPSAPSRAYFGRVSSLGVKAGPEVLLSTITVYASSPSVAWTGTRYGILWTQNNGSGLRHAFVDAAGTIVGPETIVGGMGAAPRWTWNASANELEATWLQGGEVYVAALSPTGTVLVRNVISNANGTAKLPAIASGMTNRVGVVWQDARTMAYDLRFSTVPKRVP